MADVLALTALPAVWRHYDVSSLLDSLAEILQQMLDAEFVYVRAAARPKGVFQAAYGTAGQLEREAVQQLGLLTAALPRIEDVHAMQDTQGRPMRTLVTPLGMSTDDFIAIGCARPDFPQEAERTCLRVAANQATMVLRQRAVEFELRRHQEQLSTLNEVGRLLCAEQSLQTLLQAVTDQAVKLSGAEFGAFFYNNVTADGESYLLYTLSGVPREVFAGFPLPRNSPLFDTTFRGEGIVRADDITQHALYGKKPPYYGMPEGHLPVRSYLAVPVIAREGTVLGGLFFGHSRPGVFGAELEATMLSLAAQAAVLIENVRLYESLEDKVQLRTRELQAANLRLRELDKLKSEFLASMSHELRTPLNSIIGFSHLLLEGQVGELNAEQRFQMSMVAQSAGHLLSMINDLLDVARIESGKTDELELQRTEQLGSRLGDWIDSVRPAAESKQITIDVAIAELGEVYTDLRKLQRVVLNLLSNAVKFTEVGGKVSIAARVVGRRIRIDISDTGIGIDAQGLASLFRPFARVHPQRRLYEGSGLGLYLSQKLMKRMHGHIEVESVVGEGSLFTLWLRRQPLPAVPRKRKERPSRRYSSTGKRRPE
jgi:signal transduction histidine kinase